MQVYITSQNFKAKFSKNFIFEAIYLVFDITGPIFYHFKIIEFYKIPDIQIVLIPNQIATTCIKENLYLNAKGSHKNSCTFI